MLLQVAVSVAPDEHIDFSHLKRNQKMSQLEFEDEVASDLQRATGLIQNSTADSPSLSRMLQLSGDTLSQESYGNLLAGISSMEEIS